MKTVRTPLSTAYGTGTALTPVAKARAKDYFGKPEFNGLATSFGLNEKGNGHLSIAVNTGALSNPYFQAGRAPKRLKNLSGQYVESSSAAGNMTQSNYEGFGRPSMQAVGTVGFPSNGTIPGNSTVMFTPDAADEVPDLMDIAIIRVSNSEQPQIWSSAHGMLNDDTPRESYTIPSFNRMIAMNQKAPRSMADLITPEDPEIINWNDPISILNHFYVYGIVNDSMTIDNRTSIPRAIRDKSMTGSERRKAGITISGRDQCYNLWGPLVPPGSRLFLILRPTKLPGAYITNSYRGGYQETRLVTEKDRSELKEYPFQLVPYATQNSSPPDSELLYTDELGVTKKAPYVLFGTCYKRDEGKGELKPEIVARDISFVRKQGGIDILVHV